MVSALITVAVIAWCAQLALGGWQISRFNRAFDTLCQQGRVGVGKITSGCKSAECMPVIAGIFCGRAKTVSPFINKVSTMRC